jgi:hypothetical protein
MGSSRLRALLKVFGQRQERQFAVVPLPLLLRRREEKKRVFFCGREGGDAI